MTVDDFVARAKQNRHRGLVAKFQNLTPDFLPAGWTYDDWFEFEERAAVLEFEGAFPREEAEELALVECGLSPDKRKLAG